MFRLNLSKDITRVLIGIIVAFIAAAAIIALNPPQVQAQCDGDALHQTWLNVDPNTRSIRRIELNYPCNDYRAVPVGGLPQKQTNQYFVATVRVYGSCHPRDCDWGYLELYDAAGPEGNRSHLYAHHDSGFAQRRLDLYLESETRVKLVIQTRFTDNSGRADYTSVDYFF